MSALVVTLRSPALAEDVDLRVPGDVPVAELLPRLVTALRLPPGDYALCDPSRQLLAEETLVAAGVLTGAVLFVRRLDAPREEPAPEEVDVLSGDALHLSHLLGGRGEAPADPARALTLWAGPAGGTGRTTLALALAMLAVESRPAPRRVVLLALSEPSVSVHLLLPRRPNASAFFTAGDLHAAEQAVSWDSKAGAACVLRVVLGPANPRDGRVAAGAVGALVDAACAAYDVVVIDLPPLTPGGDVWTLEPLARSGTLALVASPSASGVVSTVEALVRYHDVKAGGAVHVALNRRTGGGLSVRDFTAGVANVWGFCPPVTEIPFFPTLPGAVDRGEWPALAVGVAEGGLDASKEERRWAEGVAALARAVGVL
ncbi:MAG: hypothetical protein JXD18_08170 [Anaerolineae bacterium]|nr:hypothetical protein [Anaerolineae bacterium]